MSWTACDLKEDTQFLNVNSNLFNLNYNLYVIISFRSLSHPFSSGFLSLTFLWGFILSLRVIKPLHITINYTVKRWWTESIFFFLLSFFSLLILVGDPKGNDQVWSLEINRGEFSWNWGLQGWGRDNQRYNLCVAFVPLCWLLTFY